MEEASHSCSDILRDNYTVFEEHESVSSRQLSFALPVFFWDVFLVVVFQDTRAFLGGSDCCCLRHQQLKVSREILLRFPYRVSEDQSFGSSAVVLGTCPIFIYWTLFTPTYLARLTAGTSSEEGF